MIVALVFAPLTVFVLAPSIVSLPSGSSVNVFDADVRTRRYGTSAVTPDSAGSDTVRRLSRAVLFNANACRDYAASLTKQLDERLVKEAATQENREP